VPDVRRLAHRLGSLLLLPLLQDDLPRGARGGRSRGCAARLGAWSGFETVTTFVDATGLIAYVLIAGVVVYL